MSAPDISDVADNKAGAALERAFRNPPGAFVPAVCHFRKERFGFGLALSRQTLLDHGGDLWVENLWVENHGAGAHFPLRLPG